MPKRIGNEPLNIAKDIVGYENETGKFAYDYRSSMDLDPNNLQDKIEIYERQVKDWFLIYGQNLSSNIDSGFVALMIAISYIEGVEQYRNGESSHRKSKKYFVEGFKRIFELSDNHSVSIDRIYSEVRNGLFHNGMSGGDLIINLDFVMAVEFTVSRININPTLFMNKIVDDFEKYILALRDTGNSSLRSNFDRMFTVT